MKSHEELLAEVQALKAQLEDKNTYIQQQDEKIQHLENINGW